MDYLKEVISRTLDYSCICGLIEPNIYFHLGIHMVNLFNTPRRGLQLGQLRRHFIRNYMMMWTTGLTSNERERKDNAFWKFIHLNAGVEEFHQKLTYILKVSDIPYKLLQELCIYWHYNTQDTVVFVDIFNNVCNFLM